MRRGLHKTVSIWNILLIAVIWTVASCSTSPRVKDTTYRNSTIHNLNPAPQSMSPPDMVDEGGERLDAVYMRSQADYHYTLGEAYSLEGNSPKAIEEFKLTLIYDPKATRVKLRLASEYVRQGLLSEAIEQVEEAVKEDPDNLDGLMLLGGLHMSLKMYDLAIDQYQSVLVKEPNHSEAAVLIGAIYAEQKKYDQAIKHFKALARQKKNPQPELAYYYIGRIHLERGEKADLKLAEQAFEAAISIRPDYEDAVISLASVYQKSDRMASLKKLLSSFQDKFGPHRKIAELLSQTYLEEEDYPKAYEQLYLLDGFERDNLNIKFKMALILVEQKEYVRAANHLEEILIRAPDSERVRFYLGAVYEETKNYSEAISHFNRISSGSPYYPEAVIHTSYLYKLQGDYEKAVDTVKAALKLRQDIPQFYSFYASLLDDQKEYEQALKMLSGAVEKFPSHTQLRFFLGSMHDRVGNPQETINQMQRVLEIDENHVQALNYLAYTFAELNTNLGDAENLARKALSFKPNDGYIMDTIGWILFKRGDYANAVKYLEAAHKAQSSESVIAEHLGDAYYKSQLVMKAKKMYRKAVEMETDEEKRQKIQKKLLAIEQQQNEPPRSPASAKSRSTNSK